VEDNIAIPTLMEAVDEFRHKIVNQTLLTVTSRRSSSHRVGSVRCWFCKTL